MGVHHTQYLYLLHTRGNMHKLPRDLQLICPQRLRKANVVPNKNMNIHALKYTMLNTRVHVGKKNDLQLCVAKCNCIVK